MLRQIMVFLLLVPPLLVRGQEIADTIRLQDMVIRATSVEKYAVGYKIILLDSTVLGSGIYQNMSQLLGRQTPLFFKSYGNGMISTISFRGTGPSHTAVFWNGLPLNQPSVGQTDFSLLPVIAADKTILQFGPASPMAGSGAIGGSIVLATVPAWDQGYRIGISQDFSDFGQSFSSLSNDISGKKAGSRTRVYLNSNPNSFVYKNITRAGGPLEKQDHARVFQGGALQDFYFKTGKFNQAKISGWYNDSFRELQPVMSDRNNDDDLREKSLRIAGDFSVNHPGLKAIISSGYSWDYYLYNRSERTVTNRVVVKGEAGKKFIDRLDFRVGAQVDHVSASADAYQGKISEDYLDLYSNLLWNINQVLDVGINARQQFSNAGYAPFAPSAGANILIFSKPGIDLRWTVQAARSYRIPTLNDRYWMPGGNESLKPERGGSVETGFTGRWANDGFRADWMANIYHMRIHDWILWMPEGEFWSARNVKEVWSSGLEFNLSVEHQYGSLHSILTSAYSYTRSVDHSSGPGFESINGKQLPYTPSHNGRMGVAVSLRSWHGYINYDYTGKRYITADNSDMLRGYQIIDAGLGTKFYIYKSQVSLSLHVNNVLNADYQVMSLRAMPRRNFGITIKYMFNGNHTNDEKHI